MFLTNVLSSKAKSKFVLVALRSLASGHIRLMVRERAADKLEQPLFDPYVQDRALYKEFKRVRSI